MLRSTLTPLPDAASLTRAARDFRNNFLELEFRATQAQANNQDHCRTLASTSISSFPIRRQ